MQNETIPSMILAIDTIALKVSPSLPPEVPVPNDTNTEEDVLPPNEQMEDLPSRNKEKTSRLEQVLTKIKIQLDYTMNLTERELKKLKMELKDNQKEAVEFITDCFDDIMEDNCFITWLANGSGYKPNRLKQILKKNKPSKRNRFPISANQPIG